jgi:predicted PurR-regulated permease PerM
MLTSSQAGKPNFARSSHDRTLRGVLITLLAASGMFLAWEAAGAILVIFAGLLVAALLNAGVRYLSILLPIDRGLNLAIVCLLTAIIFGGIAIWSGYNIVQEVGDLARMLGRQINDLEKHIARLIVGSNADTERLHEMTRALLPNPSQLFGGAAGAFFQTLEFISDLTIVTLIGIFVAANPAVYRDHILLIVPSSRRRQVGATVEESADMLERWIIGQLIAMVAITISTWLVLLIFNVPKALLLATIVGLLNFIPYLGALLGAAPIALAAVPLGVTTVIWVTTLFTLIQSVMGYAAMPLIQRRAVHMPPALTLGSLMVFGSLFGAVGIALATPIVALVRFALFRLRGKEA